MLITFSFMMMHVMLNRLKVTNIVINYICKIYNNISTRARLCYWVVSHIPHIIASSLVHLSETNSKNHTLVTQLATGGFRDVTRIASSNADMWRDITFSNQENILHLLEMLQQQLDSISSHIRLNDTNEVHSFFSGAKSLGINFPLNNKVH